VEGLKNKRKDLTSFEGYDIMRKTKKKRKTEEGKRL